MKKVTGHLMVAAPFVALFIYSAVDKGILVTIAIFSGVGILMIWLKVAIDWMDP